MKSALITGITGQDGSYLAEFLLARDYAVHGIMRRASTFNTDRVDHLYHDPHDPQARLFLHYGDLTDGTGLRQILEKAQPDEVYNLGSQSHVKVSFFQPEYTADTVAAGALRLLEAVRDHQRQHGAAVRFYQAGSSEMYGASPPPQNENTPFHPPQPVCRQQSRRALVRRQLSGSLRSLYLQRHSLYPPAAARPLSLARSPAL
jgi:GDPmannose 4,6-dehydratase